MKKNTTVIKAGRWSQANNDQARNRLLRGLIRFTADQIKNMSVMKVGRPIRWQDTSLIICPVPTRYWAATPIGTYSSNGWDGFVIVWNGKLMRVPTERAR